MPVRHALGTLSRFDEPNSTPLFTASLAGCMACTPRLLLCRSAVPLLNNAAISLNASASLTSRNERRLASPFPVSPFASAPSRLPTAGLSVAHTSADAQLSRSIAHRLFSTAVLYTIALLCCLSQLSTLRLSYVGRGRFAATRTCDLAVPLAMCPFLRTCL